MGGISFIHVGFLAGALAIAVPIAIHLLFRQRPRRVEIGSLRFLKIALREHVRRRKIKRWVLLALRVAGVLLLALLFARPYRAGGSAGGNEPEVAFLVDQSASMAAGASGRSNFARAQEEAAARLRELPEQSHVHLAYCDAAAVEPMSDLTIDPKRTPGFSATDYGKALAWARDLMALAKRADRRVVFFTDLQRSGLDGAKALGWPPGVSFELVDVGRPLASNVAVVDTAVNRTDIKPGEPIVVSALMANTGILPARDVSVRLELSSAGAKIEQKHSISLDAGDRQLVRFSLGSIKPGLYQGSVAAEPRDPFPIDDRRWLAFDARAVDRVLLVDGDPGDSVFASETYYLETALRLRPPGKGGSATPYEPVRAVKDHGQSLPGLIGHAVVVLANVGGITDADASALREYVVTGGKLIVFLGSRFTPADADRLRSARVFPAAFLEFSTPGSFRFATWDKAHPILKPLSDPQHGDLRRLEFRTIAQLKPEGDGRVLAATAAGEPLLIEGSLGTGKILVFAFPAGREWGDWPVSRLYVPLVHQTHAYLTDRLPETQRVQSGPVGPGRQNPPGTEHQPNHVLIRNLEPRESESERVDLKEFVRAYGLPENQVRRAKKHAAAEIPPGSQRPDELWRSLVWALFGVLVIETILANRTQA